MKGKYIVSDMDGVLLDTMPMWIALGPAYVRAQGRVPRPELGATVFHMNLREAAEYIRKEYGIEQSNEEMVAGFTAMADRFYAETAPLKSGVAAAVPELCRRGYRCGVVTAATACLARAAFRRTGLDRYFDYVFSSHDMVVEKDSPEFFPMLAERLGTSPGEMILLEDSLVNIRAARSAGVHTIALFDEASAGDWPVLRQTAEAACRDFSEILNILE